jgi:hypothetical protein
MFGRRFDPRANGSNLGQAANLPDKSAIKVFANIYKRKSLPAKGGKGPLFLKHAGVLISSCFRLSS